MSCLMIKRKPSFVSLKHIFQNSYWLDHLRTYKLHESNLLLSLCNFSPTFGLLSPCCLFVSVLLKYSWLAVVVCQYWAWKRYRWSYVSGASRLRIISQNPSRVMGSWTFPCMSPERDSRLSSLKLWTTIEASGKNEELIPYAVSLTHFLHFWHMQMSL